MKIAGIYKITSPSGRVYIGQSWDIKRRWYKYKSEVPDLGQPKLCASFNKYGAKSHIYEICHELPPDTHQSVMDVYEILYISIYRDIKVRLLNVKEGGSGGRHSDETKAKISRSQKGVRKGNAGSFKLGRKYVPSEKQRQSISRALKGRSLDVETKKKLSISLYNYFQPKKKPSGANARDMRPELERSAKRVHSAAGRERITAACRGRKPWNLGVKMTEEAKIKMSQTKTGVKPPAWAVQKRALAVKKWWAKRKEGTC